MSVQTEIDRISTAVQNAHLKVIEKGGTSTAPYLVANLPDAIDTIPEATDPKLQAKTATPSETAQTVKPDSGYDGLSQVSVGAISKTYVGSGVTKQAAKTVTPSTSSQTAVASGVYTTGAVTVAAIPSSYVKPSATKAATTYTPTTSNQTIAAGTYCSGTQTIKGDANLLPENIKSGVSIFDVLGTLEADGGGAGGSKEIELLDSGSFTLSAATVLKKQTIDHAGGKVPLAIIVHAGIGSPAVNMGLCSCAVISNKGVGNGLYVINSSSSNAYTCTAVRSSNMTLDWTDAHFVVPTPPIYSSAKYKNTTYTWEVYG